MSGFVNFAVTVTFVYRGNSLIKDVISYERLPEKSAEPQCVNYLLTSTFCWQLSADWLHLSTICLHFSADCFHLLTICLHFRCNLNQCIPKSDPWIHWKRFGYVCAGVLALSAVCLTLASVAKCYGFWGPIKRWVTFWKSKLFD